MFEIWRTLPMSIWCTCEGKFMRRRKSENVQLTCAASFASLYWWRSLIWFLTIFSASSCSLNEFSWAQRMEISQPDPSICCRDVISSCKDTMRASCPFGPFHWMLYSPRALLRLTFADVTACIWWSDGSMQKDASYSGSQFTVILNEGIIQDTR